MWNIPTQQRLDQIPKLYETENIPLIDKFIYLHFFLGSCDWYVCEFDGQDTFWGFVILNGCLQSAEWGYFTFSELKSIRVYGGTEVDCEQEHWRIRPAFQVDKIRHAQGWALETSKS
jgi:hypothetical protein